MRFDASHSIRPPISSRRRDRLYLLAGCTFAVVLAISLRNDRPVTAVMSATTALQHSSAAEQRHLALVSQFDGGRLSDSELAERLQSETLPKWKQALELMQHSREAGASGHRIDELSDGFRQRVATTEQMIAALRAGDLRSFNEARDDWKESKIEASIISTADAPRAVLGGG